jgi:hypothetical protein
MNLLKKNIHLIVNSETEDPEFPEGPLRKEFATSAFALLRVSEKTGGKSLHALKSFNPGDLLIRFQAKGILPEPDRYSVQLAENKHLILDPDCLQYINHSCRPNVFFDLPRMSLLCLRPIAADDEITFFYPSTEWSMAQGFSCQCGSPSCLGYVCGARYVSSEVLRQYKLSEFIEKQHHLYYNPGAVRYPEYRP